MVRSAKEIVAEFYQAALNDKDVERALALTADDYRQHNPLVRDGKDGFRVFIEFLREHFPDSHNEVKRIIAEDDLVALHVHSVRVPGTVGRAIVDIFRVEDGLVAEHWDVIQAIPELMYPPTNTNGFF